MFSLTEIDPAVEVPESEYLRLLGYPRHRALEGRSRELADAAREWFAKNASPWICAHEISSVEIPAENSLNHSPIEPERGLQSASSESCQDTRDEFCAPPTRAHGENNIHSPNGHGLTVRIGGTEFSSPRLRELFTESQTRSAVLVAVSAGRECEERAHQLWEEGKPDEYFFLEVLGSAVVEQLIVLASGRICGWADDNKLAALPYFSPGYSGWDIAQQIPLWNLFRHDFNGKFPGPLEVLESGMLRPKKSQLAVIGLTRDLEKARRFARMIPCESCSLPNCRYRRAAYKRSLAQIEVPVGHSPQSTVHGPQS
jgi:hypothetical protein